MLGLVAAFVLGMYFFFPGRTNLLLLGIDTRSVKSALGRSDTMILTTVMPTRPYVGLLSIPRDLWVSIPGVGENRINTAHFFAESVREDSGPAAAMDTIRANFGVDVDYYVRIRFSGFADVVDALGGLDITLQEPMSGYEAGTHHLTGSKALALVRDRSGSDDFFRMARGQLFLKAVFKQVSHPRSWPRLPAAVVALGRAVDTNVPFWLWPRLGLAVLRLGPDGLDSRAISREMVTGTFIGEANVLLPNWELINPVLLEMFGQ
jgi:LCP family protein required for cell wall assembly